MFQEKKLSYLANNNIGGDEEDGGKKATSVDHPPVFKFISYFCKISPDGEDEERGQAQ